MRRAFLLGGYFLLRMASHNLSLKSKKQTSDGLSVTKCRIFNSATTGDARRVCRCFPGPKGPLGGSIDEPCGASRSIGGILTTKSLQQICEAIPSPGPQRRCQPRALASISPNLARYAWAFLSLTYPPNTRRAPGPHLATIRAFWFLDRAWQSRSLGTSRCARLA